MPGSKAAHAVGGGIGVFGAGSTLFFVNSVASDCHAASWGGALYAIDGGAAILTDSVVIDCTAQKGGAIAVLTGGAVEITRSFVKACVATDGGGGVFVGGAGSFKATDSSFVGCACLDGDGGALLITAGLVSISGGHTGQCVAQHGGAMHAQGGQLECTTTCLPHVARARTEVSCSWSM